MIRITLEALLLFLVPFGIYALWVRVTDQTMDMPEKWSAPVFGLALAGLMMIAIGFAVMGLFGEREFGTYVPAHVENGRFVSGSFQ
jgi:amino acid permease